MRFLIVLGIVALGLVPPARAAMTGSVRMFVRHEVADYAAWRTTYDALGDMRSRMGVRAQAVYRSAENLNDITVTHDFADLAQARRFAASPELKLAMQQAGVTGAPEIWFTTLAAGHAAETNGVRMYVRHEVADFAAWRRAYAASAPARRRMGVISQSVHRSADDPNELTVTHDFKTVEMARSFASSAELREAMKSAGVTGAPRIWFTLRVMR